ncbi:hypothetical protein [Hydrogenophaga sp.]|uniref:hypothetical protein n=1 Tax=Hydrogenophaga sp. TaxID=1904254 RepID=UPI002615DF0F|nr:hypothetical protein [Hydrogenophaga sp.]
MDLPNPASPTPDGAALTGEEGYETTHQIDVIVYAMVPEFNLAMARASDGHTFAITRKTSGIDLDSLKEGQRLACTVTVRLPRVLTALPLA